MFLIMTLSGLKISKNPWFIAARPPKKWAIYVIIKKLPTVNNHAI
jgi:hypothetical protein